MKEKLYTIPLTEAFQSDDECAFCFIERNLEKAALDYTLGTSASYMESDTREKTDHDGFCRDHYKKMFAYGNALGNSLILQTRMRDYMEGFEKACKQYTPTQKKLFSGKPGEKNSVEAFFEANNHSCFICNHINRTFERYIDTFYHLLKHEDAFRKLVFESKGICMHHLEKVLKVAPDHLSAKEQDAYIPELLSISSKNMQRVKGDVDWLIDKFDYRNAQADWKNSKDALSRGIGKMQGGYPGDKPYEKK